MKLKKIKRLLSILLITGLSCLFITKPDMLPVEQLDVEVALGADIVKVTENNYEYEITRAAYIFEEENKRSSRVLVSRGTSFAVARENRQQRSDKPSIGGLEKVYILSETYSRFGIRSSLDITFKNPRVNDIGIFLVCKDSSKAMLEYKVPGYASSADFIEELIANQEGINFFPREFDAMNIYVRLDAEGRSVVLPYIEIKEEGIVLSGEAVFNGDKMVTKLDMKDSRVMNMLKYNNVRGIVTLQKNSKKYLDISAKSKRMIKCLKKGNKYYFIIDLKLKGQVITNSLFENLSTSSEAVKELETAMAEQVKKECNEFIGKMKNELKVDCLELGRTAAAKYSRRTGTDWNEVISNSDIKINVNVEVDLHGRGNL